MVGYKDTSNVARKPRKLHRKKSNNQPIVSFIHNGSEIITTMMEHSFKIKSIKSRVTCLRQQHLFLISSCRSLDQHNDTGVVRQLTKTAIFIATPMKKHLAVHFTKGCFFVNCLTQKLRDQCQSITWFLQIQARFLFFS